MAPDFKYRYSRSNTTRSPLDNIACQYNQLGMSKISQQNVSRALNFYCFVNHNPGEQVCADKYEKYLTGFSLADLYQE